MKNLNLTFGQRLGLSNFLALATGPLGKMAALQRVYDAVRFLDDEVRQVKVTDLGGGMSSFEPPTPEFGAVGAQIEDADAAILAQEIDACQQLRVVDMGWVNAVKAQIGGVSVVGKRRK